MYMDQTRLNEAVGYKPNNRIQGFTVLDEIKSQPIVDLIASVSGVAEPSPFSSSPSAASAPTDPVSRQPDPQLPSSSSTRESQLTSIQETIDRVGEFDPKNDEDARERTLASLVRRQGQLAFRASLIRAYTGRCAITGYDAPSALEAAHILSYKGEHTNHVSNGLLLRADLHALFDLGLIAITTSDMTVVIADKLRGTMYRMLAGTPLLVPEREEDQPSVEALDLHRSESDVWPTLSPPPHGEPQQPQASGCRLRAPIRPPSRLYLTSCLLADAKRGFEFPIR